MLTQPAAIVFRAATPDDAAPLAAFAERTFRETFAPHNTEADMDSYCAAAYTVEKIRGELDDPARHVIVAVRAGELVGYAQLCAGPAPECVTGADAIEVVRLYVDGRLHGRGLAGELMAHTLAAAERRGARTVYLGVWEKNGRAIAFYAKHGFRKVGSHPFVLGSDVQTDEIMARPIP